jgi:alginate O-acetyltransferase complex protein AlgI
VRYGAYRCGEGLFLKVVVADGLAPAVRHGFDQTAAGLSPMGAWYSAILFGGQIFADFAGYTGIAIGVACLLGLRFPENFRAPYISTSLSEFWSRWHISLSSWLRDYLYVPLGGNRRGRVRTYVNLMIVMLLGGLWHGASWKFVFWGGLHGGGLAIVRALSSQMKRPLPGWARVLAGVAVFAFVHVAWVFFRAQDLETARVIVRAMLVDPFAALAGGTEELGSKSPSWRYSVLLIPIAVIHLAQWIHERFAVPRSEVLRAVAAGLMLFAISIFRRSEAYQFIYFQF